jgi:small subunit ribosomal protein S14
MAKKSAIEKNNRRKRMVKKYAAKREQLRAIANDKSLPMEERFAARLKLAELPRNSAANRVRNRCEVSGRPRGYYRKLAMSRIALRELANQGLVPGVVKSSW